MIYIDLILNLSLLVALSIVSAFVEKRWPRHTRVGILMQGFLFGGTAVLGMLRPLVLSPGLIFDGRSVMVSLCALFFGPWAAALAGAMAIACRLALGGAGALMGVLVVLSSIGIGIFGHFLLKPWSEPPSTRSLYLFGLAVHAAMLAMTAFLPEGTRLLVLLRIGPPVIMIYPLATILVGKILSDQVEAGRRVRAIEESEARFRELADLLPQAVYEVNAQGILTYANRYAFELFGYSTEDFEKGLDVFRMIAPEDRDRAAQTMRAALAGSSPGPETDRQYRAVRKAGGSFPVMVYSSRIVHEGSTVGLRGIIVDISDHQKAEEEREKLQAQLLQAQKMESVGRLAGGVAHDFNNMLGIIIGNAEMAALRVDDGDPVHRRLQEILKASQRSADIVRQLLAFARKQTISPKVLDLNDAIEGMLKMLRRLIGEDIDLAWIPGYGLWNVKIDPSQVNQIFANLAVNALDAIAGPGKLTIETDNVTFDEAYCAQHEGLLPGAYVRLAVSDNGSGMPREVLEHLFEPFFTTKGMGKGTGLGLSTIYGIVKQNDGFINVYSEPGQGTTFRVYLPRCDGEAEIIRERALETIPKGTETILVAEDEGPLLNIARDGLTKQGYAVLAARTPAEALALSGEHRGEIHLLVTDVVMPAMNGRELAERLRQEHPGMKCLFMSGYTANVVAHHGVLDEGVHFIQKPFSHKSLAEKVRAVLDGE